MLTACGNSDSKDKDSNSGKVTVGIVNLTGVLDPVIAGFKAGMAERGYEEGENITYIYDGPVGNIPDLDAAVQKLLDAKVDLIFSLSTPATQAAKRVTEGTDVPVIFGTVTDPVGAGIVNSLTLHEGNIAGIKTGGSEPKQLEWFQTIVPELKRVFIPHNPNDASSNQALDAVRQTASALGLEIVSPETPDGDAVLAALQSMPDDIDGILILPDSIVGGQLPEIISFALEQKIPLAGINESQADDGTLMAYGPTHFDVGKQASRLAYEVFQGTSPADLPIEPAEFRLSINLRTARAIDLEVDDSALGSAQTIFR